MAVQTIPADGHVLVDWRPEDKSFWSGGGEAIARRNLWISIPALLLAFAVWMVWSAVVINLPRVAFAYSADQLFWLAALPGLSGATLRIFYSFMVPIFGGRRWTAISTASLLVPAVGIGIAVQNPNTPYWLFLLLALLCGFGGGNFASSMANMKPVALVERAIRNSSKSRDIVLDPFGGAGSTLIACDKAGRQARLVELDPKYVDTIILRWQEFSGGTATLDDDGRTYNDIAAEREAVAA